MNHINNFLEEYEQLCMKYGLYIDLEENFYSDNTVLCLNSLIVPYDLKNTIQEIKDNS